MYLDVSFFSFSICWNDLAFRLCRVSNSIFITVIWPIKPLTLANASFLSHIILRFLSSSLAFWACSEITLANASFHKITKVQNNKKVLDNKTDPLRLWCKGYCSAKIILGQPTLLQPNWPLLSFFPNHILISIQSIWQGHSGISWSALFTILSYLLQPLLKLHSMSSWST